MSHLWNKFIDWLFRKELSGERMRWWSYIWIPLKIMFVVVVSLAAAWLLGGIGAAGADFYDKKFNPPSLVSTVSGASASSTPMQGNIKEQEIPEPTRENHPVFTNRFTGEVTVSSSGINHRTEFGLDGAGRLRVQSDPKESLIHFIEPLPLTLALNSGTSTYTFTRLDESHRVTSNDRSFVITLHSATSTRIQWGITDEWIYDFDISEI